MQRRPRILLSILLAAGLAAAACILVASWSRTTHPPRTGRIPQVAFLLSFRVQALAGEGEIRFDRETSDACHRLTFRKGWITLEWVCASRAWPLAKAPLPDVDPPTDLAILRHGGRSVVTLGHRHVLSVDGLELGSATPPEIRGTGGWSVGPGRVQPLGRIHFADDFMRDMATGDWRPVSGAWEICSTSFAETSSNPFCLYARGPTSPEMEELDAERAGREFVGIGIQIAPQRQSPTIVRVTGNSPASEAGLAIGDRLISVDGQRLENLPHANVIALLAGKEGTELTLEVARPGSRETRTVRLTRQALKWGQIDHRVRLEPYTVHDAAIITAGHFFWDQFEFAVAAKSRGRGAIGLVYHYQDPGNYSLLRWWGDTADDRSLRMEIVRVQGTRETILAQTDQPGGPAPFQYYRLGLAVGSGTVTGCIDGREVIRADVPDLTFGAVGLYARESDGAYFDDVLVTDDLSALEPRPEAPLPQKIREDPLMAPWAGTGALWVPQLTTGMRWHRDDFPHDVRITLREIPSPDPFRIILAGDGTQPTRGYVLQCTPAEGKVQLLRDRQPVESASAPDKRLAPLTFERRGKTIRAQADKVPLLQWDDPAPLTQTKVGVQVINTSIVDVDAPGTLDYAFTSAPLDWQLQGGHWGMLNRWVCDPRWSWFGGRGRCLVSAWNNHILRGDVSVEAYLSVMMIREERPLERPADIGLTLGGDGRSVFSGYTFLVGGDNNSWTRLYRNGEKIAGTSERMFLLPEDVKNPRAMEAIHRHWFHLRISRIGSRIVCSFQGMPALQFTDPSPLGSGKIAIWTVNNGVLIGRVRISAQEIQGYDIPVRHWRRFEDDRLTNWVDGEVSALVECPVAGTYRVVNRQAGGPFAVRLRPDEVPEASPRILEFDARFDPGVKVDLYFMSGEETLRYILTGDPRDGPILRTGYAPVPVRILGQPEVPLDDGNWHTVRVPLSGPAGKASPIRRITFANYTNPGYLMAGLTGNPAGSGYSVRNPRITASPDPSSSQPDPRGQRR